MLPADFLKKTKERVPKQMLNLFATGNFKFDVHVHLFNKDYIPDKYFGIRMPYLVDTEFLLYLENTLEQVQLDEDDKLYNYANYLEFVSKNSMPEIAEYLINNSPKNTIFCPLMMDFSFGIDGKTPKNIFDQIEEMREITNKYPCAFLPFIAINPNNPKHFEIFTKVFSEKYKFFGIKIYPTMGFMPSSAELMKIFEICEQYNIPVTTHSGSSDVRTNHTNLHLKYFALTDKGELVLKKEKKTFIFDKQFDKFFNRPENWEPVLKAFPKLRLNLAHFGGNSEWDSNPKNDKKWIYQIIDLMERYPNVYSDISYILHFPQMPEKFIKLYSDNDIVSKRALFGTDFYMLLIEGKYQQIRTRFASEVGSKIMHKLSVENPLNFLNLTELVPKQITEQWQQQTL
jgi:predicted TIM-barrel fold metal-dependent hydrolase